MRGTLHLNSGHVGAVTEGRLGLALCWWMDALRGSPELWEMDGLSMGPACPVSCGPWKEQITSDSHTPVFLSMLWPVPNFTPMCSYACACSSRSDGLSSAPACHPWGRGFLLSSSHPLSLSSTEPVSPSGWSVSHSVHTVSIRTKLPSLLGSPEAPVIKAALKKAVGWSVFVPWYNAPSGLMREQRNHHSATASQPSPARRWAQGQASVSWAHSSCF